MRSSAKRKSALLESGISRKSGSVPIIDPSVLLHRGDFFTSRHGRESVRRRRGPGQIAQYGAILYPGAIGKGNDGAGFSRNPIPILNSGWNSRDRGHFANHHVCASHPAL